MERRKKKRGKVFFLFYIYIYNTFSFISVIPWFYVFTYIHNNVKVLLSFIKKKKRRRVGI